MQQASLIRPLMELWTEDPIGAKEAFTSYFQWLTAQPNLQLEMIDRPGISYSLRVSKAEKLHALIDVIDDDPQERWLSVCFYAHMVTDPDGLGDAVPQGLMGQDALCFNLDTHDPELQQYIFARLQEAVNTTTCI